MQFSQLVTSMKKYNKTDGELLVIMPFFMNYNILSKHLSLLKGQTCQSFDLIIVLNALSDERKVEEIVESSGCKFGIVLAKRKEDTGSAGGYFTGERYAIENGYDAVVIGDDDCLPIEKTLLEKAVAKWKGGALAVAAESMFVTDEQTIYTSRSIPFYGLIDISLLKTGGLHYLPMYIGADDWEFILRTMRGVGLVPIDSFVIHPARHSIFANFSRSLLYRINTMLLVVPNCIEEYLYGFAFICPIYLIFGSRAARDGALHILKSVIIHKFGKDALLKETAFDESPPKAFDRTISSSPSRKATDVIFYDYSQVRGGYGRIPAFAASVWGKTVLLDLVQNYSVLVSMMCAKETWIESARGTYLIARNPSTLARVVKIFLFTLVFPLFLVGAIASYFINWARKPDTRRYGLD
ncbi:MAG: hypothetical protein V1861_04450 [Candidatus Micrarchaeota archaeon]